MKINCIRLAPLYIVKQYILITLNIMYYVCKTCKLDVKGGDFNIPSSLLYCLLGTFMIYAYRVNLLYFV